MLPVLCIPAIATHLTGRGQRDGRFLDETWRQVTEDVAFRPRERNFQCLFDCTSHICFYLQNSQLKSGTTLIKPPELSDLFLKNRVTVSSKHSEVRAAPAAWCNCSKGVTCCQAPWEPLLWDWRQEQPCCKKTAQKRHQSTSGPKRHPRRAAGEEIGLQLGCAPHCSLPWDRRGKQRGPRCRLLLWRGPSRILLRDHAVKYLKSN